jgi:murein DD-endopeptidase MepM/ murein hydrolase activator NlpD
VPSRIRSSARAKRIGVAATSGVLLLTPGSAGAGNGGTGGTVFVPQPTIKSVRCVSSCASERRARAGSLLKIKGSRLSAVRRVVFHGSRGTADDIRVRVKATRDRVLKLRVPMLAGSGPLSVWVSKRVRSRRSRRVAILPPPPPRSTPELTPVPGPRDRGAPLIETGTSRNKVFYASEGGVTFSYRVRDNAPVKVQVELMRATDGSVVRTWSPTAVPPGQVRSVTWNGAGEGRTPKQGRYQFRLLAEGQRGATARSARDEDVQRDAFDFYRYIFPIRARHDFGSSGARFGAGRSGHSHQGQDVFARCGSKLVAARGGKIQFKGYHSAAGYYLVIDGDGTGFDYAYMHLQGPSPFNQGDRVYTGQEIGRVGETGNARGCHLHFEMWTSPGWYDGGHPIDPLPHLLDWDRVS